MATTSANAVKTIVDNKYLLVAVVGSGQFGDVYKAQKLDTNEFFALKSIELDLFDNIARLHEMADSEIQILEKINNPNVVKLIEHLRTKTHLYTIYELCTGGTLEELLDKRKFLPEKEALPIFRQVLNGFKPLITMNIMHRDIKPSNILFHEGNAKIGDFGFCKPLSSVYEVTETMVGSPIYMAPEILKGQQYSIKADIYSMGVMLYEMLYGRAPYEDVNIPGLLNKISKGNLFFPSFNPVSPSTQHMLKRMLVAAESQRITWDELFEYLSTDPDTNQEQVGNPNDIMKTLAMAPKPLDEKDNEFILTMFTKDCKETRDKMIFLWRTFSQGYDYIIDDESHLINFLTLKKLNKYSKDVEKIVHNQLESFSPQAFKFLKAQFDYKRISSILTNEVAKFNEALSIYKNYIQTVADSTKTLNPKSDPAFTTEYNDDLFVTRVKSYVQVLRERFQDTNNDNPNNNLALYLNLLLDCAMLDEIYDSFFEVSVPFNDQSYMKNLFDMNEKELLELADEKISCLKAPQKI